MKRISFMLCAILLLSLFCLQESANADSGLTEIRISSNISGADIYVNGEFVSKVTPDVITASPDDEVSLCLPGYTTQSQVIDTDEYEFELVPELYPDTITDVKYIVVTSAEWTDTDMSAEDMSKAPNELISLDDAVRAVIEDESDTWYVISFAESLETIKLGYDFETSSLTIDRRGRLTINGENRIHVTRWGYCWASINVYTSDVRIVGMIFDTNDVDSFVDYGAVQLRVPQDDQGIYNVSNVYITGCSFNGSNENGINTMGERGFAATEYNGAGTTNYNNIVFSGNHLIDSSISNFMAYGDEDYNVTDGVTIAANSFVDSSASFVVADAHSWYAMGYDEAGAPAFSDHNVGRNITISGNSFSVQSDWREVIVLSTAGMGNSDNRLENVTVRNNTVIDNGGQGSVMITNAGVCDGHEDLQEYNPYIVPEMEHTDSNIFDGLTLANNTFVLGTDMWCMVANVTPNVGRQCGSSNVMQNIIIEGNVIDCGAGLVVTNYFGNGESGKCYDNHLNNIGIFGNRFEYTRGGGEIGVTVAGSYLWRNLYLESTPSDDTPDYAGTLNRVIIRGNTFSGYRTDKYVAENAGEITVNVVLNDIKEE